jgi:aspartyl protease family protein
MTDHRRTMPCCLGTGFIALAATLAPTPALAFDMNQDGPGLVHALLLLLLIGSTLVFHYRNRFGQAVRHAAGWFGIFSLLAVVYAFRGELMSVGDRVLGELVPGHGSVSGGEISFPADKGGHFRVEAAVNGVPVTFVVDTGATRVTLSPDDAARIGFTPDNLSFTGIASTANGMVRYAPVRLDSIAIGPVRIDDVAASVNGADLGQSLLGMSFLGRLSGYRVENGRLYLTP